MEKEEKEQRDNEELSLRRVGKFPKLGLIKKVFAWENDIRAAIYAARNDRPRREKLPGGGRFVPWSVQIENRCCNDPDADPARCRR